MCTRARLVQGSNVSPWFGMPMPNAPVSDADVRIEPGEDAYLEVTIDPAAHGEAGLGQIQRGIRLTTTGGQELNFTLTANVVEPQ